VDVGIFVWGFYIRGEKGVFPKCKCIEKISPAAKEMCRYENIAIFKVIWRFPCVYTQSWYFCENI